MSNLNFLLLDSQAQFFNRLSLAVSDLLYQENVIANSNLQ